MAVRIPLPSFESFEIFNSDFGEVVSAFEGTFVELEEEPALILPISLTNEVPQKDEEYFVTYCRGNTVNTQVHLRREEQYNTLNSFLWFSFLVFGSIVTASWMAFATCCESQGFTTILPFRLWAAPANSDKIITPCRSC